MERLFLSHFNNTLHVCTATHSLNLFRQFVSGNDKTLAAMRWKTSSHFPTFMSLIYKISFQDAGSCAFLSCKFDVRQDCLALSYQTNSLKKIVWKKKILLKSPISPPFVKGVKVSEGQWLPSWFHFYYTVNAPDKKSWS